MKYLKYLAISFLIISVGYYLSLVVVSNFDIRNDYRHQRERLEVLRENPNPPVTESDFVNFDISNNDLKLNEIQVLATHNSFKAMPNMYISKFLELFWGQKTRNTQYGMPYLTDQLDSGIRGLELDITMYGNDIILMHDPLTDWRTNGPDFAMTLEEINIWSDQNSGHVPVHIMIQIRSTWSVFTHKFGSFERENLIQMEELLDEILGEKIIRPGEIIGNNNTLTDAIMNDGWPMLNDSLGRFYFTILFDDKHTKKEYIDIDPDFKTQNCFVFTRLDDGIKDYSAFILADCPFQEGLKEYVDANHILRTRVDVQFSHPPERLKAAIELGSVILATDYPEGHTYDDDYICRLTPDNKTVLQRGSVTFSN